MKTFTYKKDGHTWIWRYELGMESFVIEDACRKLGMLDMWGAAAISYYLWLGLDISA